MLIEKLVLKFWIDARERLRDIPKIIRFLSPCHVDRIFFSTTATMKTRLTGIRDEKSLGYLIARQSQLACSKVRTSYSSRRNSSCSKWIFLGRLVFILNFNHSLNSSTFNNKKSFFKLKWRVFRKLKKISIEIRIIFVLLQIFRFEENCVNVILIHSNLRAKVFFFSLFFHLVERRFFSVFI